MHTEKRSGLRWLVLVAALVFLIMGAIFMIQSLPTLRGETRDLEDIRMSVSVTEPTAPELHPQPTAPAEEPEPPAPVEEPPEETLPAEPEPEPEPEPAAPVYSQQVEETLEGMSLQEKVCQMIFVYPATLTGVSPVTVAGETTRQSLERWPVGGLIYNTSNFVSEEQTKSLLSKVQTFTKVPLILTLDEEGGRVNRLMQTLHTTYLGPMLSYKDQGADTAEKNAYTIASDIRSYGFNLDLAPVADIWSNPANTVIGDRAYSSDFAQGAELVAAAVEGFHRGGVGCTLKHFPGHGDTTADSHYGAAYVTKTLDELREEEFLPFRAGIEAGADAVMVGHLIVSDVEQEPAVFSYKIVTELLREELGFDGVVMTDGLEMQAMTDYYGNSEIAVRAVQAGCDVLLGPASLETAVNALLEAVETGKLSEERIDESVRRILQMKVNLGLL